MWLVLSTTAAAQNNSGLQFLEFDYVGSGAEFVKDATIKKIQALFDMLIEHRLTNESMQTNKHCFNLNFEGYHEQINYPK